MTDLRPKKGRLWLVKAYPVPDACPLCVAIVDDEKQTEGIRSKEFIPYYRLQSTCPHEGPQIGKPQFRSVYADIPAASPTATVDIVSFEDAPHG